MRSVLLSLLLLACAPRRIEIRYRTDPLLGAREAHNARPVLVGLYPLKYVPANLPEAACSVTEAEATIEEAWSDALAGELSPLSAIPGQSAGTLVFDLPKDARWLLLVPYYQYKCSLVAPGQPDDVDEWAVVRLPRTQRPVWLEMRQYQLVLPWESTSPNGTLRRQRGCVENEASHVYWPWCS